MLIKHLRYRYGSNSGTHEGTHDYDYLLPMDDMEMMLSHLSRKG